MMKEVQEKLASLSSIAAVAEHKKIITNIEGKYAELSKTSTDAFNNGNKAEIKHQSIRISSFLMQWKKQHKLENAIYKTL
ncbi:hypothetical protein ACJROX_06740 [Pseudalkalibacillus sp. A8]|uniref:hypothetical protein n=1 Tax=Pseudalkalibacillus sp. A8 TaxID=3382641 RepID=UPI0038B5C847